MKPWIITTTLLLFAGVSQADTKEKKPEFNKNYEKEVDLGGLEETIENSVDAADLLDESVTSKASEAKTKFDFDGLNIDGSSKTPAGFLISGKKNQKLRRMIKLRSDFKNELSKSSHQLPAIVN